MCERNYCMKAAIVILNWNGADMMKSYLPSVINNSKMNGVEVIVADNGSTDDSVNMLKAEFPDIPIICLKQNLGFAKGYNTALKQIDAEYYVLLNSDVEIKDNMWITPILEFMDNNIDVAACQPKLLSLKQPQFFEYAGAAGGFIDKYGFPFCRGRILATVEMDNGQYDQPAEVMWASGAALVVRKDDFWNVGGLDDDFFAHMEEIDLCWRLRAAGKKIMALPCSRVYHLGGASLNQGNPRKTYLNFRNNLIMLFKNLDDNDLKRVMRIRKCLDLIAACSFFIKGDLPNCKSVFKARKDFNKLKNKLLDKRMNIKKFKVQNKSKLCDFSIIWQYYFKRRKTFDKLPFDNNLFLSH